MQEQMRQQQEAEKLRIAQAQEAAKRQAAEEEAKVKLDSTHNLFIHMHPTNPYSITGYESC